MFGFFDKIYSKLMEPGDPNSMDFEKFSRVDFLNGNGDFWICFPGWGMPIKKAKMFGLLPKSGNVIVYHGPKGIVGVTPKQTIENLERVCLDLKIFLKSKKIKGNLNFYGLSTGCLLATYLANSFSANRLVLVSPSLNLSQPLYRGIATKLNREFSIKSGYSDAKSYNLKMKKVNPENNFINLPKNNIQVYSAKNDKFILNEYTQDFVEVLRNKGIKILYKNYVFLDHVSLTLFLGFKNKIGLGIFK